MPFFVSVVYNFYHLFTFINKVFSVSGTSYWMTDSSVKSIPALTFVAKCLWLVYTICVNSLIVTLLTSILVFSNSDILIVLIPCYPLPSLNWTLKLPLGWSAVSYVEIVKRCLPKNNIFGQYDHYSFINFWFCISRIALYSFLCTHPFCYLYIPAYMFFQQSLKINNILRQSLR